MPDNPGKALGAPQFTDNQGAPGNPEETPHREKAPASSEGNDESFVDEGTRMECSVAGRNLNFLADAPYLLKNLRGHLVRQQTIVLDDETVVKNKFPTNEISLKYVEQLCEIDEQHSLKLASRLKQKHLNPSHFDKMNVGTVCALFDLNISAVLRLLVEQKKIDEKAVTTTWYLDQVFRWF
ncbi:hypothetical protein HPB51_000972 [Rhipicephalus microplus]|uniref:Uncharacterized protein n=1 Tax=Rhipicephalus microplus TaxID=6941 RepID=A0A9J6DLD8_RHIMP|nr:hypothetical protein HPB51_000972 [Rhipicephalus microplus]